MAPKKPAPVTKRAAATTDKLATVPKNTALATNQSSADLFEQHAGAGMENVGREDLAIPRINLIQSGSPQVKKGEGKYIKGAEAGDFLDSVQNLVYARGEDGGFIFVPCSYRRANIEFIPRKKGGGFVKDHGASDDILRSCTKDEETGAMMLANGNEIVTTGEFVGLAMKEDGTDERQVCISLAKTAFSAAKKLNTYTSTLQVPRKNGQGTFNPPSFYSAFAITSVPAVSKKTGDSYMAWSIVKKCEAADFGDEVIKRAFALYEGVRKGAVKVAQPDDTTVNQEPEPDDSSL